MAANAAAGGAPSPMLVDGSAADTRSLKRQAQQQVQAQALKALGTDSPKQMSMRQQMEAKMLAKFNRAVAPPAMMQGLQGRSVYQAQEERAEAQAMPDQQALAGAFGGTSAAASTAAVEVEANPNIARMMNMGRR